MALGITLYESNSEPNRLNKNSFLDNPTQITGYIRDNTSIIDPVIRVEMNLISLAAFNYMYIADFNRYYFINNIVSISNGICELHAHVDVLSSFREEILLNYAILAKSENHWNLYLNDGTFKIYSDSIVLTLAFPMGFTRQNYLLAVASP